MLLLENNIRGGVSSVMGPRYVEADETTKLLYIDANNLYGWAMSQYLPTDTFEKLLVSEVNYYSFYYSFQTITNGDSLWNVI